MRISRGFFTHRDMGHCMALYLSKYTRPHIHSFCHTVPNVSISDAVFILFFRNVIIVLGVPQPDIPASQIGSINHVARHNNASVTKKEQK